MHYVYLIQSIEHPSQTYTGFTSDLKKRLDAHNQKQSQHTSKYAPWELVTYIAFRGETKAIQFEQYLKTSSGRAFANKRLRPLQ